jgi:hypothetical protein
VGLNQALQRPDASGPITQRSSASGGARPRPSGSSAGVRSVINTATGSPRTRRSAKANAASDARSSHCVSSNASTRSHSRLAARSKPRVAAATLPRSCAGSSRAGSARSNATSSARRCGAAKAPANSSYSGSSKSRRTEKASCISASAGLQLQTRRPRLSASAHALRQSVVFPIPGSPSRTSTCDSGRSIQRTIASSSASRPTREPAPSAMSRLSPTRRKSSRSSESAADRRRDQESPAARCSERGGRGGRRRSATWRAPSGSPTLHAGARTSARRTPADGLHRDLTAHASWRCTETAGGIESGFRPSGRS